MLDKNYIFADKANEFISAIDRTFSEIRGQKNLLFEEVRRSEDLARYMAFHILRPIDCIVNKSNYIRLKSHGMSYVDNFFFIDYNRFRILFTPMGAWQVCLLMISTNLMPLSDMAEYMRILLMVTPQDRRALRSLKKAAHQEYEFLNDSLPCSPKVLPMDDGKTYEVIYQYWNDNIGYVEQHVYLTCDKGFGATCGIDELKVKVSPKFLYPYFNGKRVPSVP